MYLSGQNLLSSRLLSKNLKLKIYKTIILSVLLYGIETEVEGVREKDMRGILGHEGVEVPVD